MPPSRIYKMNFRTSLTATTTISPIRHTKPTMLM